MIPPFPFTLSTGHLLPFPPFPPAFLRTSLFCFNNLGGERKDAA